MTVRPSTGIRRHLVLGAALVTFAAPLVACAADIPLVSHRALYTLSLLDAKPASGIVGASGMLGFELAQVCDGWTNEQRYRMHLIYQENAPVDLGAAFVTWESTDGKSYRFDQRKTRNGDLEEELHGTASLTPKGGTAVFDKPSQQSFDLPAGTIFPTAHTMALVNAAEHSAPFFTAEVFDGTSLDGASLVTATFSHAGPAQTVAAEVPLKSPLLDRPGWKVRLGFFPDSAKEDTPDYELAMTMLDNGVGASMVLDYGDYELLGTLTRIEAVKKPHC